MASPRGLASNPQPQAPKSIRRLNSKYKAYADPICNIFFKSNLVFVNNTDHERIEATSMFTGLANEETIGIMLQKHNFDALKLEIKKNLDLCVVNSFSQLNLERVLKQTFEIIFKYCVDLTNKSVWDAYRDINELLITSYTYQELYEGFYLILDILLNTHNEKNFENQNDLADQIEEYIKTNYLKQINHHTLSEKYHFVAPYFMQIYRRYKGISPNDYILELRIEKAKELLLMNHISISK